MMYILVDGMNIAMRSHFVHDTQRGLSTEDGVPTGMVYGFLKTLVKWGKKYDKHKFIVAWDDLETGSDYRRDIYPQYKANRPRGGLDEGGQFQMDMLQQILTALGIKQVRAERAEADDVIATICRSSEDPFIILTSDRDMLQLVGNKTVVLTPKGAVYDAEKVEEEYGVPPNLLTAYRALDGDTSDNIPRVPRVRKKTLARLTNHYEGDLTAMFQDEEGMKATLTPSEFSKITAFRDQAYTNKRLIGLRELDAYDVLPGGWDEKYVKGACDLLEFSGDTYEDLLTLKRSGFVKTAHS